MVRSRTIRVRHARVMPHVVSLARLVAIVLLMLYALAHVGRIAPAEGAAYQEPSLSMFVMGDLGLPMVLESHDASVVCNASGFHLVVPQVDVHHYTLSFEGQDVQAAYYDLQDSANTFTLEVLADRPKTFHAQEGTVQRHARGGNFTAMLYDTSGHPILVSGRFWCPLVS